MKTCNVCGAPLSTTSGSCTAPWTHGAIVAELRETLASPREDAPPPPSATEAPRFALKVRPLEERHPESAAEVAAFRASLAEAEQRAGEAEGVARQANEHARTATHARAAIETRSAQWMERARAAESALTSEREAREAAERERDSAESRCIQAEANAAAADEQARLARKESRRLAEALALAHERTSASPHDYTDDLGSHDPDRCRHCRAWAAARAALNAAARGTK